MNRILREEFVRLHTEEDLLGELHRQLREQFSGRNGKPGPLDFPPVPARGKLSVGRVKASRYFFS